MSYAVFDIVKEQVEDWEKELIREEMLIQKFQEKLKLLEKEEKEKKLH